MLCKISYAGTPLVKKNLIEEKNLLHLGHKPITGSIFYTF